MIQKGFRYVAPEVEEGLITRGIGFVSAYRSIEQYLEALSVCGVIEKTQAIYKASRLVEAFLKLRERDERRRNNRENLIQRADKILNQLPEGERGGLNGTAWLAIPQENGISLAETIERDDSGVGLVFSQLRAIEATLFKGGRIVEHILTLPLTAELVRQRDLRKAETDAREANQLRMQREAGEARLERLRQSAAALGDDGTWLAAPHQELANLTPLEAAGASELQLEYALTVLGREIRRRMAEEKQAQALIDIKSELENKVIAILDNAARPFLVSPYKELGGKKPLEFCIDSATLKTCEALAEKMRRARR